MNRTILIILAALMLVSIQAVAQNEALPEYTIVGEGTGAQGTYLVSVTVTTKDKQISDAELVRCAVHGVLFRGFSNKDNRQSQKPLAGGPSVEASHPDFFNSFFADGGVYASYASVVNGSRKSMKSGKLYKVTCNVTVNKDALRQDLEKAGIIKGLNSAF